MESLCCAPETNSVADQLYFQNSTHRKRTQVRGDQLQGVGWRQGELEEGGQKAQTSGRKISKDWGWHAQHD